MCCCALKCLGTGGLKRYPILVRGKPPERCVGDRNLAKGKHRVIESDQLVIQYDRHLA